MEPPVSSLELDQPSIDQPVSDQEELPTAEVIASSSSSSENSDPIATAPDPAANTGTAPADPAAAATCTATASTAEAPALEVEDTTEVAPKKRLPRRRTKAKRSAEYAVKFSGNDSERWDGKVISIDAEWLEELYPKAELGPGRIVELPWEGRDGKNVGWRAIIMEVPTGQLKAIATKWYCA